MRSFPKRVLSLWSVILSFDFSLHVYFQFVDFIFESFQRKKLKKPQRTLLPRSSSRKTSWSHNLNHRHLHLYLHTHYKPPKRSMSIAVIDVKYQSTRYLACVMGGASRIILRRRALSYIYACLCVYWRLAITNAWSPPKPHLVAVLGTTALLSCTSVLETRERRWRIPTLRLHHHLHQYHSSGLHHSLFILSLLLLVNILFLIFFF